MDQIMGIIKLYQRIELIKLNQGLVLVKSSQDIPLWHIGRCPIMIDGVKINRDTPSFPDIIFETYSRRLTLTPNIIINSLTWYTNNYLGHMTPGDILGTSDYQLKRLVNRIIF